MRSSAALRVLVILAPLAAGCAARTPPMPAAPAYPDFLYPVVPGAMQDTAAARRVEYGWRYLQSNDLRSADREFARAIERSPALYPAQAGAGYVDLAGRNYAEALAAFDGALAQNPQYVPALVGRGQALVGLGRDEEAIAALEAALAVEPSLADLRRRIEVLRFRTAQELVEAARKAAQDGRLDDARAAYRRAIEGSPGSAFLHRELAIVERRWGDSRTALAELRTALELDPGDVDALIQMGEIFEARLDYASAEAAYRKAYEIDPAEEIARRIEAAAEHARLAKLPPEFHAIPEAEPITRGQLAALIGIKLGDLLQSAPGQQVVLTDVRSHWAQAWIEQVARAGIVEPFPNHTYQPRTPVRRGDLAAAASRLVLLAAGAREQEWKGAQPALTDIGPGHLSYPAVTIAVASGVMPPLEGGRFAVTRPVSGAEAIDVIDRIQALARGAR
jgi:tetratricopeptide (TPR) repeat protein